MFKLIALMRGWREAYDYDVTPPLLVVSHPALDIHFTGADAWRVASKA